MSAPDSLAAPDPPARAHAAAAAAAAAADPPACLRCGELEDALRGLSQKQQSTADKLADHEDEIRRLRALHHHQDPALALLTPSTTRTSEEATRPSTANPALPSRASRFSSLLSRKSISNLSSAQAQPAFAPALSRQSEDDELRGELEKEKGLRTRAEGKLNAMSAEMEDLSVTLFQQANEMVAEERKARAKLEERVDVLEKRDLDKRRRLERLENAMQRIDRVRGLLAS